MCGIVGMVSKNPSGFNLSHRDMFTELLVVDQLRGIDSTGVYGCRVKDTPDVVKAALNSTEFVQTRQFSRFANEMYQQYKMVIGHNRAATKGKIIGENAHPFVEGKITLVHNGTIRNQAELNADVEVDSHAITHALNDNDAAKALESINGAFALVWYDSEAKTLNLARNAERPLVLVEADDSWIFASESGMIWWLAHRNGIKIVKGTACPAGKIITFNMDDRETYTESDFKDWVYKAPPPPPPSFPTAVSATSSTGIGHNPVIRDTVVTIFSGGKDKQDLHKRKAPTYVIGSKIMFKVVDYKEMTSGVRVLGHPVYDNFMDENIFVSMWLPELDDKTLESYMEGYHTGYMTSYTLLGNQPTYYVRDVHKVVKAKTSTGDVELTEEEFNEAVQNGCRTCNTTIFSFADIGSMFMRPRKDNTWRISCKQCWLKPTMAVEGSTTLQ